MLSPYAPAQSLVLRDLVPTATYEAQVEERANAERSAANETTAEDVLERLFPAFDGGDIDGVAATSVASTGHLGRLDVIHLQEELEERCARSDARPFGVCPTREAIYDDCFNEVIRQAAVPCPERGELLAELRDEVHETQRTYDMLFESACQYGARKAIERDLKRTMQAQLEALTKEASILDTRVNEMRAKYEGFEKRFQERRSAEEKKHNEEAAFLKKGNSQLTNEIKRLTN
jgi:dynein light intermediate chain